MKSRVKLPAGHLAVGSPAKRDEAVLNAGGRRAESALYDFSVDAGAIGVITFGRKLPAGAIVTDILTDVVTALTSGGLATVQIAAGSVNLTGAIAFGSITGTQKQTLASAATAIKIPVAADLELQMTIAVAALTAGKLRILVNYSLPNDGHHD